MALLVDERPDGSVAVFLDGDLQFDSRDERVYHELLVLPALAIASRRSPGRSLTALICGGGDGLAAREVLKSTAVRHLDLVDYDPTILDLARTSWPDLNAHAFDDPRITIHVRDAGDFVAEAQASGWRYDLIICDFTVPRDRAGARLHSLEWYEALRALLHPDALLAVNVASPSLVPQAFWSVYNTLRAVGLAPRPYRIPLPSFRAQGYGNDWGFCLAAPAALQPAELDDDLVLPRPRVILRDATQLRRCFIFSAAGAETRRQAPPTHAGSDWLLQALATPSEAPLDRSPWNGLGWQVDDMPLPPAEEQGRLLPAAVRQAWHVSPHMRAIEQAVFERLLALMPALRPDHTRVMVQSFLAAPERFLEAINLPALVDALLRRAAALPRQIVVELRLLRSHLRHSANPHHLWQLGLRIVSIMALVVMLSNLLHPDMVYGKGGTAGDAGAATGSLVHTDTASVDSVAPPAVVSGRGFQPGAYGTGHPIDETGTLFPSRSYRYSRAYYGHSSWRSYSPGRSRPADPNQGQALYRLTPEADLLQNGEVVIALNDKAGLLLADDVTTLFDSASGEPILFLKRDPALIWRTFQELTRQKLGLGNSVQGKMEWMKWMDWINFAPWQAGDAAELANLQQTIGLLDKSMRSLGPIPLSQPAIPAPPVPGAIQLWSSVWIAEQGGEAIVERGSGDLAFVTRDGWWKDAAHADPIGEPYPEAFRTMLVAYLKEQTADGAGTVARITSELQSANTDLTSLKQDQTTYTAIKQASGSGEQVEYGTSTITVDEALRLTVNDLNRTVQLIDLLQAELTHRPQQQTSMKALLAQMDR